MHWHSMRVACALALAGLWLTSTAHAQISFVDTQIGQSSNSTTVASATVTAATNHLYLAAVSSKTNRAVTGVTGMGLTWFQALPNQCSGNNSESGVSIWWAIGTPTGNGVVTATLAVPAPSNAVIIVSRYSGVDTGAPIGNVVSANTNGVSGSCTGGAASSSYSLTLSTTVPGDVVFCAAARRNKNHTPGAGYSERREHQTGMGNNANGLAVEDRSFATPSSVVANGSFTNTNGTPASIYWAAAAVEIHAAVHPFLYFKASDLATLRSGATTPGERKDIYDAVKAAAEDQTDTWRGWLFETPTDPGADEGAYQQFCRKMASLAFVYVLNPALTNYRDKALEFADKLVEIHATRTTGGWGGTVCGANPDTCYTPNDARIDGLPYCIRYMTTVYDWLYDEIPNSPPPGKPYRSKSLYRSAIDAERQRLREAIDLPYTNNWINWWPNSWMQNHSSVAYVGYAIATWGLDGDLLANEVDQDDRDLANDAMVRIKAFNDDLTPDGVWQEGMHYSLGILEWSHAFHVQQTVQGVDNWPHVYLDHYADWLAANVLDNVSRSVLIRRGDLGGNDPPVSFPPQYGGEGNRIGAGPLARAHIGSAKALTAGQRAKCAWVADQFRAQDTIQPWVPTGRFTNIFYVLDHMIEYFVYTPVTPVAPTAKRYSFPDRHNYVWTNGYTVNDAKVGNVGGGYAGDHAIDILPAEPWKQNMPLHPPQLNAGHSHEDAGQYYFRKGHTELATEYGGRSTFLPEGPYHNILLIDPLYAPGTPDDAPLTLNPKLCGQYKGTDGGTDATLDPTRATTPHDRWLGPSPDAVRADYLVQDLSPRYQEPRDESGPPVARILTRYDRRTLWLRDVAGLGPVLFVHDEVEGTSPHTFEWRNHSPVPVGGMVAPSSVPSTLPFWRVDCPDGVSLALATALPTVVQGQPPQGAPFDVSAHQHHASDPGGDAVPPNPPWFVRVSNTVPVESTHMGFMMFPVSTAAWQDPAGPPPNVTNANFSGQYRPAVLNFVWNTPGYGHVVNFMDDGAEQDGGLLVDGLAHVSAAYVSLRDANGTAAKAYLFWGTKAIDYDGNRHYILLDAPQKLADIMTETNDAGRLDINVTAHNQASVTLLLNQALFYEHPTSSTYITSVYVDGVDVDAENPRRFNWQHETIAGKSHVRLLAVGGGGGGGGGEFGAKPVVTPLRTMLSSPVETGPGGPFSLRYSIAETNVPVRLGIYDLMGRLVREFDEGMRGPGEYAVTWHADDHADHRVARGLYIVRLEAGSIRASRKVMIWRQ